MIGRPRGPLCGDVAKPSGFVLRGGFPFVVVLSLVVQSLPAVNTISTGWFADRL